jgi:hypothetical protein
VVVVVAAAVGQGGVVVLNFTYVMGQCVVVVVVSGQQRNVGLKLCEQRQQVRRHLWTNK